MEKEMKHVVIYYADGTRQVIRPTEKFDENWSALVANVSGSNSSHRNYLRYEIK